MWTLHQTSQYSRSRPSALIGIQDPWAAYQLDSAVASFGVIIENAASEQEKIGTDEKPKYVKKYELEDLLTPGFTIDRPPSKADKAKAGLDAFKALSGVKTIKVKGDG